MTAVADGTALTVPEVCEMLRLSRTTVWELTRSGELPSLRIGSARRYRLADVEAFLAGRVGA
jgi:excisionase family DNA binding protein